MKPPRKAIVTESGSGLSEVVVEQPKTDRYSRAVMRSAYCGKSIRKRSAHHGPEGRNKKEKKGHSAFNQVEVGLLAKKV